MTQTESLPPSPLKGGARITYPKHSTDVTRLSDFIPTSKLDVQKLTCPIQAMSKHHCPGSLDPSGLTQSPQAEPSTLSHAYHCHKPPSNLPDTQPLVLPLNARRAPQ